MLGYRGGWIRACVFGPGPCTVCSEYLSFLLLSDGLHYTPIFPGPRRGTGRSTVGGLLSLSHTLGNSMKSKFPWPGGATDAIRSKARALLLPLSFQPLMGEALSTSPPTPRLGGVSRESTDRHTRGTLVSSLPSWEGNGPTRREQSSPEENGRRLRSGLGTQAGRQETFQKWLQPRPLGPARGMGGAMVSAFAEAAKAKEQFSSEPSQWLSLAEYQRPPWTRTHPWP